MYAGSSMMSMFGGGASQDRVDTLQIVFGITSTKAQGLMQKHMMKVMMNMMKDGGKGLEGMPGMEDMMKMMGGGEGKVICAEPLCCSKSTVLTLFIFKGMEGMEEMMKMMGGMDGMPGMDGEMSPEDLKQTVKMMKGSSKLCCSSQIMPIQLLILILHFSFLQISWTLVRYHKKNSQRSEINSSKCMGLTLESSSSRLIRKAGRRWGQKRRSCLTCSSGFWENNILFC
jgi:hypothetical protein